MSGTDYRNMTPQERIDLIGKIWDSIEADHIPVTPAQAAELDRRSATADEDMAKARDADDVLAELRHRYR
ncbi:MAG TPA: addiction module protein [Aliidongia sp.]|nr:addiction module protein [Aliidongia sp.]